MPDSTQQPPAGTDPTPEQVEAQYWENHKTRTLAILDEWFEKKKTELAATRTSRTGGRPSLGGFLADIMFGPEPKK